MIGQTLGLLTGQTLQTSDVLMVCVVGIIVVILELALIAVCIMGVSKAINALTKATKKKIKSETSEKVVSAPADVTEKAAYQVKKAPELIDVDEKTAAVIMAIVSNESGIPLERLSFKSIKRI